MSGQEVNIEKDRRNRYIKETHIDHYKKDINKKYKGVDTNGYITTNI